MTDRLDLTEAVEAAAQAHLAASAAGRAGVGWADLNPWQQYGLREHMLPIVAASAPLIAQQVAEQIARAIEQERRGYGSVIGESPMPEGSQHSARDGGILYGLDRAADIAREWGEQQ